MVVCAMPLIVKILIVVILIVVIIQTIKAKIPKVFLSIGGPWTQGEGTVLLPLLLLLTTVINF